MTAPSASTRAAIPREIVIVANNIDEAGGAQRWARSMGEILTARGHRVHLVGVAGVADPHDYAAEHDGPLPYQTTVLHPGPLHTVPAPTALQRVTHPTVSVRRARWTALQRHGAAMLSRILAPLDPQNAVVVCVQVYAMEWIAPADTHGIPVIGMSHESYIASMDSSRGKRVQRLYRDLPRFVALTEQDAVDWTVNGKMNNVTALPNPLPLPPEGGADPDAHTCVALGRLSQEKGYDLLLEAWARAVGARPEGDWRLRLYGDGPDRAVLEAQAARLGVAGSVVFEGATGHVRAALLGGSLFLSASRAEGFPMTLLEALACGLPCIAFDCAPGVREILRGGEPGGDGTHTVNGVLVTPGNTEAFARHLSRLMDDVPLRRKLAAAAPESVARYSPEAIGERWDRLFDLVHR
jgi:glycosyltransferase involved in cell wall biosynthesis